MYLKMQRHASRADSASHQFLMRVPRDVAERVRGRRIDMSLPGSACEAEIAVSFKLGTFAKLSLQTRNKSIADMRRLAVTAHLSKVYEAARTGTVTLSQRQVVALSSRIYERLRQSNFEHAGTPEQWALWKAFTRAALERRLRAGEAPEMTLSPGTEEEKTAALDIFGSGDLTAGVEQVPQETYDETALKERCGRMALWVLQEAGIEPDEPSHLALLREVARAALQAGWQLKRESGGDYREDPLKNRFPAFQKESSNVTLPGLFDRWRAEVKPAASTVTTWRGVVLSLVKHLGNDDAKRMTAEDVVRWKDSLVVGKLSPKTINDTYLTGLRALLNYGVTNKLLSENVATGIKVAARRKAGTSKLPYTDEELARILRLAAAEAHPARRWLPLLQATSGARVGELAQLWGNRVVLIDGIPALVLRPAEDGGTFKNEGSERTIPIHPAVTEAGFLEFVRAKGAGPLFYGRSRRRDASRHASKGVTNHLAEWIRKQGFTDPRKAPTHALRHWLKTAAARAGISDSIIDNIQGHAVKSDASKYRHFDLKMMLTALSNIKLPL